MKTKSLVITLASCLFFVNLCFSPAAQGAARLDLIVEHGVENRAEAQARLALNTAINFFRSTYGLDLQRDLQIFLVPSTDAYFNSLQRWCGVSGAEAGNLAEKTVGFSKGASGATIIVNMGDLQNSLSQLFCLCHEIVHQFQSQESRDRHGSIRWMSEGVADAIAAHILETTGVRGAAGIKNYWLNNLKRAPNWPRLEDLHSYRQWFAAMDAYGSKATYGTSAVAALTLVRWKGYRPLFAYFSDIKKTGPEDAFYQAFGVKISDFEKQFRPF